MANYSDELFNLCVQNGADRAAVAAWPDFKREEYLKDKGVKFSPREFRALGSQRVYTFARTKITTERRRDDYRAFLSRDPDRQESGNTEAEAVGKLVMRIGGKK